MRKQAQIMAQLVMLDKKHGCCTFKEGTMVLDFKKPHFKEEFQNRLIPKHALGCCSLSLMQK